MTRIAAKLSELTFSCSGSFILVVGALTEPMPVSRLLVTVDACRRGEGLTRSGSGGASDVFCSPCAPGTVNQRDGSLAACHACAMSQYAPNATACVECPLAAVADAGVPVSEVSARAQIPSVPLVAACVYPAPLLCAVGLPNPALVGCCVLRRNAPVRYVISLSRSFPCFAFCHAAISPADLFIHARMPRVHTQVLTCGVDTWRNGVHFRGCVECDRQVRDSCQRRTWPDSQCPNGENETARVGMQSRAVKPAPSQHFARFCVFSDW